MKFLGYVGVLGIAVLSSLVVTGFTRNTSVDNGEVVHSTFNVSSNVDATNKGHGLITSEKNSIKLLNLKSENTVMLEGEIDQAKGDLISRAITKASVSNSAVYLLINSPGGSVIDGAKIISAIEASKVPVNTVCLELCASMAAIIHQYGSNRYSVNRSLLMFHPAAGGFQGSLDQMHSRLDMITNYVNKFSLYIAARSGHDYDQFKQRLLTELWIDGEDAVKEHFSDKLVYVNFEDKSLVPAFDEKSTGKNLSLPFFNLDWR